MKSSEASANGCYVIAVLFILGVAILWEILKGN
jgi:hypothetical protein